MAPPLTGSPYVKGLAVPVLRGYGPLPGRWWGGGEAVCPDGALPAPEQGAGPGSASCPLGEPPRSLGTGRRISAREDMVAR